MAGKKLMIFVKLAGQDMPGVLCSGLHSDLVPSVDWIKSLTSCCCTMSVWELAKGSRGQIRQWECFAGLLSSV